MDDVRGKMFLLPQDNLLAILDIKPSVYAAVIYLASLQVVNNACRLCIRDWRYA